MDILVIQIQYTASRGENNMKGFITFIREQGVVGLAVGFILGSSISKVVTSLVNDLINPIVGIFLGRTGELKKIFLQVGPAKIMWGSFFSSFIDFCIIASIVYFGVKGLGLDKLDKKKEADDKKKELMKAKAQKNTTGFQYKT